MKLPRQLPAVERKTNKCAVVPEGAGMQTAGLFDDIVGGIGRVAPLIPTFASMF